MNENKGSNSEEINNNEILNPNEPLSNYSEQNLPDQKFGVQHDAEGNIIKVAENAVPPEAWKNQKKAYDDAWEDNKNRDLEDDI
ncbi:hypothetical protein IV494_04395 [Kaistella sp. G5-32]|uniref:Uncharacterized protein n=1 Tax=Kaistella gelatinilytica TaxID=2787636 RepID=A0ABS0F9N0_9FLAO|nr:hypothetical protein [Kaistella gelatinilytica]MBF8456415.1 hypothetical protein [Kaistella gelatinilytica]